MRRPNYSMENNLVRSAKKTKGNLFYIDISEYSCFIAPVEESR